MGDNGFVSECFSSISMSPVLDEADDVVYRAANGSLCGVKRGCPSLLGYDVELNFYQVSPELIDILTGQPVVVNNLGNPSGFDSCNINCQGGFALEFWTELVGQNCTTTGNPRSLYTLLPWITNAYITDLEIGSEAVTFNLLGSTRAGGRWGTGPYDVTLNGAAPGTPGRMLTPVGDTCHRRMMIVEVPAPTPDPACDYTPVPALVP